ncbi:GDP-mannose 4,6-dehydratase [bacterium]|nr:GDP-mannose 4,6-dehydratase [bacterium]
MWPRRVPGCRSPPVPDFLSSRSASVGQQERRGSWRAPFSRRAKALAFRVPPLYSRVVQRVLITGGAGFIGSHLAEALVTKGKEVFVIDDLSTGSLANLAALRDQSRFHFTEASILDARHVSVLVRQVDFIYHLAAAVGVDLVVRRPVHTIEDNVRGTETVLAAAREHACPVLLTSTSEVYGKSERNQFREEDDLLIGPPVFARWGYACSKLLDEFLAMAYWREYQLPVIIVRLFNTVGPRQTGRYGMVLPRFVEQALLGQPLTVHGDGRQSRCFCYVSDVVGALLALPERTAAVGQVYNVGSTTEVTIHELAERVKRQTASRSELRLIPYDQAYAKGFEDLRRRVPGTEKIRMLLGWQPSQSLDDIIRLTVDYQRRQLGLAGGPPGDAR